jgi:hypothetical protein
MLARELELAVGFGDIKMIEDILAGSISYSRSHTGQISLLRRIVTTSFIVRNNILGYLEGYEDFRINGCENWKAFMTLAVSSNVMKCLRTLYTLQSTKNTLWN